MKLMSLPARVCLVSRLPMPAPKPWLDGRVGLKPSVGVATLWDIAPGCSTRLSEVEGPACREGRRLPAPSAAALTSSYSGFW